MKKRESNIELLRILATCAVILLHYNNPTIGGAVKNATGLNYYILLLECLSVNAVNIFVIISGYFMCDNNKRFFSRPLELIIQVILVKFGFLFGSSIKWRNIYGERISCEFYTE